ncbi:hypothetical protein KDX38_10185 [Pseudomonas sp. CDFA 602]|uniref:hypothetical protein n=1 Tax=Pseudomonas californiensis TaxID=2829823 RepID=UPI001E3C16C5|nr:hypothetical protein [Pseudomonas californiensis]MCD5993909.1 hypothetical protein [Pseudomonas californiensis]MCD5999588.1 hypothetical protein [Pseudomonas californiensis]
MKDPYAFGFYSACLALIVVVAAIVYSSAFSASPVNAYYFIEAASSLGEALAVIGIAGVVFKAYGSWKRETRQQKVLGVIWEASVTFREIEIGFNEWFFGPKADERTGHDASQIESLLDSSPFGIALRTFKKQCILLDKLVVKDQWRWMHHAAQLNVLARTLSVEAFALPGKRTLTHTIVDLLFTHEGDNWKSTQAEWEAQMKAVEAQLLVLEQAYL